MRSHQSLAWCTQNTFKYLHDRRIVNSRRIQGRCSRGHARGVSLRDQKTNTACLINDPYPTAITKSCLCIERSITLTYCLAIHDTSWAHMTSSVVTRPTRSNVLRRPHRAPCSSGIVCVGRSVLCQLMPSHDWVVLTFTPQHVTRPDTSQYYHHNCNSWFLRVWLWCPSWTATQIIRSPMTGA